MSRKAKYLLFLVIPLTLACNFITQPFDQARDAISTAEAFATSMPVETLMALPTAMEDIIPTLEAGLTAVPGIPGVDNMFDPSGEPLPAWNEIPIMPQAVAGQEFPDAFSYSFRVPATVDEVTKFYADNLTPAGWQSMFAMPPTGDSTVIIYTGSAGAVLTITITPSFNQEGLVVLLQLTQ